MKVMQAKLCFSQRAGCVLLPFGHRPSSGAASLDPAGDGSEATRTSAAAGPTRSARFCFSRDFFPLDLSKE
jgi:hypothetical protein